MLTIVSEKALIINSNNDFCSKYLMIVLMLTIAFIDLILFESIFEKMNSFFKVTLFYGSSTFSILLLILLITASSVHFEANKSYKLLNKSFITDNN
jgi:hypothetical protein